MQINSATTGPWFSSQSLASSTDRATWDRGLTLYLTQKVLSLEIKPMGDYWQLLAAVQGSQRWPYQVSIELSFKPNGEVANWTATAVARWATSASTAWRCCSRRRSRGAA